MAAIQSVQYFDDLESAEGREVEATHIGVHLALDGRDYTIDLGEENYKRLIERLEPFIAASRRGRPAIPAPRRPVSRSKPADPETQERNRTIRAWAAERGFEVKERGHIPKDVVRAYEHEVEGANGATNGATGGATGGRIAAIRARIAEEAGVPEETLMGQPDEPADGRMFEAEDGRPVFETRAFLLRAVRLWAKGQGEDVPAKGRIPDRVMAAWIERHGEPLVVQSA